VERRFPLQTNFRLPCRLVALSNAMVDSLKYYLPGTFDDYFKDT
jgi:hypothetical protein